MTDRKFSLTKDHFGLLQNRRRSESLTIYPRTSLSALKNFGSRSRTNRCANVFDPGRPMRSVWGIYMISIPLPSPEAFLRCQCPGSTFNTSLFLSCNVLWESQRDSEDQGVHSPTIRIGFKSFIDLFFDEDKNTSYLCLRISETRFPPVNLERWTRCIPLSRFSTFLQASLYSFPFHGRWNHGTRVFACLLFGTLLCASLSPSMQLYGAEEQRMSLRYCVISVCCILFTSWHFQLS